MQKTILGRTGIEVSRLGLGGLAFRSNRTTPEQALAILRRAVELGVNYVDTAPGYGDSELCLGKCLRRGRNVSHLATLGQLGLRLRDVAQVRGTDYDRFAHGRNPTHKSIGYRKCSPAHWASVDK